MSKSPAKPLQKKSNEQILADALSQLTLNLFFRVWSTLK